MSAVIGQILAGGAGGLVESVGKVIDDLTTSDKERMDAELEGRRIDNQLLLGQQETNKVEAANASMWVAGWRPGIGWVCVAALFCYYIPKALFLTAVWVYAGFRFVAAWNGTGMPTLPPFPDMGIVDILGLVTTLLGSATLRHRETMAGTARSEPLTPFKVPNPFRRSPKSAGDQEAP